MGCTASTATPSGGVGALPDSPAGGVVFVAESGLRPSASTASLAGTAVDVRQDHPDQARKALRAQTHSRGASSMYRFCSTGITGRSQDDGAAAGVEHSSGPGDSSAPNAAVAAGAPTASDVASARDSFTGASPRHGTARHGTPTAEHSRTPSACDDVATDVSRVHADAKSASLMGRHLVPMQQRRGSAGPVLVGISPTPMLSIPAPAGGSAHATGLLPDPPVPCDSELSATPSLAIDVKLPTGAPTVHVAASSDSSRRSGSGLLGQVDGWVMSPLMQRGMPSVTTLAPSTRDVQTVAAQRMRHQSSHLSEVSNASSAVFLNHDADGWWITPFGLDELEDGGAQVAADVAAAGATGTFVDDTVVY